MGPVLFSFVLILYSASIWISEHKKNLRRSCTEYRRTIRPYCRAFASFMLVLSSYLFVLSFPPTYFIAPVNFRSFFRSLFFFCLTLGFYLFAAHPQPLRQNPLKNITVYLNVATFHRNSNREICELFSSHSKSQSYAKNFIFSHFSSVFFPFNYVMNFWILTNIWILMNIWIFDSSFGASGPRMGLWVESMSNFFSPIRWIFGFKWIGNHD